MCISIHTHTCAHTHTRTCRQINGKVREDYTIKTKFGSRAAYPEALPDLNKF